MGRIGYLIMAVGLLVSGCATLNGGREQGFACPYDTVWDATLQTMKSVPLTSQDKERGRIETGWVDLEGTSRGFGLFGREGFGNRERARMTVDIVQGAGANAVRVVEERQRWHARGGVTSQATKWSPIEPSEQSMTEVLSRIHTKLKDQGCSAT
ncbi:MAG: hypothetical protein U0172_06825 [Nitrospiraceae bacterium]